MYAALAVVQSSMHLVFNVNRRTDGMSFILNRDSLSLGRIQHWLCNKYWALTTLPFAACKGVLVDAC